MLVIKWWDLFFLMNNYYKRRLWSASRKSSLQRKFSFSLTFLRLSFLNLFPFSLFLSFIRYLTPSYSFLSFTLVVPYFSFFPFFLFFSIVFAYELFMASFLFLIKNAILIYGFFPSFCQIIPLKNFYL